MQNIALAFRDNALVCIWIIWQSIFVQDYFCSTTGLFKAPTVDGNEYNKGTKTFSPRTMATLSMKLLGYRRWFFFNYRTDDLVWPIVSVYQLYEYFCLKQNHFTTIPALTYSVPVCFKSSWDYVVIGIIQESLVSIPIYFSLISSQKVVLNYFFQKRLILKPANTYFLSVIVLKKGYCFTAWR
jgi:hypothetical protein